MGQEIITRQVSIARPLLEQTFRRLLEGQDSVVMGRAGINRTPRRVEYICGEPRATRGSPHGPQVVIAWEPQGSQNRERARHDITGASPIVLISVEREPVRGRLHASVSSGTGDPEPIHTIRIIGSGLYEEKTLAGQAMFESLALTRREQDKWSRVAGALTEPVWQRLRSLHYCIVGLGRSGSLVATSLTRLGANQITLIDPDQLEIHNIDSMDGVTERDVGRLKVSAVRDYLRSIVGKEKEGDSATLAESITTLRAFGAAKEADVLVSCVDHDGARMATAIIATLYAKPMLDFGTGVFFEPRTDDHEPTRRRMGGDFRLILPYERCLLCFGGLGNMEAGRSIFENQRDAPSIPWNQQRAGSLRSLNQIVAHLGISQFQDLVAERVTASRWLHFEVADDGVPSIQLVEPPRDHDCPLCRFYGIGDDGLSRVSELRQSLTQNTTNSVE